MDPSAEEGPFFEDLGESVTGNDWRTVFSRRGNMRCRVLNPQSGMRYYFMVTSWVAHIRRVPSS